jgi:hypothetical protein
MAEDRPMIKYGQDELTFSLNDKSDRRQRTGMMIGAGSSSWAVFSII